MDDIRKSKQYILGSGISAARQGEARNYPKRISWGKEWQDARFNDEFGYHYWLNEVPVRIFPACGLPKITKAEKANLYDCALLMEAETNMLSYRCNDNWYKPLTIPMLAQRLELSERQTYRFLSSMYEKRIMASEQGRIYMNPCYFFRGRYLSYHLFRLFETDLRSILPQWVVDRYDGKGY